MNHWLVTLLMLTLTTYALIGDDVKHAFFTKMSDIRFDVLTVLIMTIMALEILLQGLCRDNYFKTFYGWLNICITLSMLLDVGVVLDAISGTDDDYTATTAAEANTYAHKMDKENAGGSWQSEIRVVRAMRLLRLVRIGRLWPLAYEMLERLKKRGQVDEVAFNMS